MNPTLLRALPLVSAAALACCASAFGQELLLQEDFNTDGAAANPPRYTVIGGFASEAPHPVDDVGPDQTGPVYWARNTEVSFTGVPAPTAGRRAALAWDPAIPFGEFTADALKLITNTLSWLANGKANPTIVVSPGIASVQGLSDELFALGYNIVDDDPGIPETDLVADVLIKVAGGGPSRFANSPQGVLSMSSLDHDDMLLSSIGATATFTAQSAAVTAASHPIANGLPATLQLPEGNRTWNLLGDILPGGATTVATMTRSIPPTAASIAQVERLASGEEPADTFTESVTEFDFSDASSGDYFLDYPIPGGASGVWGMIVTGELNVTQAGTYSFALGIDDGARLRIDTNRNGLGEEDDVIVEDAAGAHRLVHGDATFSAPGLYDFEVVVFNSGGGGNVEMSVSIQEGGGDTSDIFSGTWELLGATSGAVGLSGAIQVNVYVPTGPDQEVTVPLLMALNGPDDTPPGAVFGGGPFEGYEGTGFFGGAGLNKWLIEPIENLDGYRSVRLNPVNVAGKENVKVTIALAATFLDFETSDFLDIIVYPNGAQSEPVTLARFSAPNDATKYFVDMTHGGTTQLGLMFQDFTYDVPPGATDLIVEIRSFTSWWNEIVAFDNIRVTAGALAEDLSLGALQITDTTVELTWTGGQSPFVIQHTPGFPAAWSNVLTNNGNSASVPRSGDAGFYRVQSGASAAGR